jgi:hypothetical protein
LTPVLPYQILWAWRTRETSYDISKDANRDRFHSQLEPPSKFSPAIVALFGIIAFFSGHPGFGLLAFFVVLAAELYSLFLSQIIVQDYNNKDDSNPANGGTGGVDT